MISYGVEYWIETLKNPLRLRAGILSHQITCVFETESFLLYFTVWPRLSRNSQKLPCLNIPNGRITVIRQCHIYFIANNVTYKEQSVEQKVEEIGI